MFRRPNLPPRRNLRRARHLQAHIPFQTRRCRLLCRHQSRFAEVQADHRDQLINPGLSKSFDNVRQSPVDHGSNT